ncbi:MAG: DedA family protein [Prevotellaceae bacterium]|jgi:membrane protein YqaA with SNARE-associated domain|nr:DedA family protein [Prevotellaceae bacterium]
MENIQELSYYGLFLATTLAATIIPFSADVVYIAFLAFGYDIFLSLIVATSGNWIGSLITYGIGRVGNIKHIEKWFRISLKRLEKQQAVVNKYRSWLALFVWLPLIGDVFAIALGFYKINFRKTAAFMLLGKFLRFSFLSVAYYFFTENMPPVL